MSMTTDKQIAEILATFGEPLAGNVWRVQGTAVIYHKALERIAAQAKIRFDIPTIVRAERDEAVLLVTGRRGEHVEWSLGEALVGVNYRVSGKQAAYVYAMAEKRAKDRVILKLIGLHGLLYSEEEADEFRGGRPQEADEAEAEPVRSVRSEVSAKPAPAKAGAAEPEPAEGDLRARIEAAKTINAVTDLMLDPATQKRLNAMPSGLRDEVREQAKARLVALGWPAKTKRAAAVAA